MAPIEIGENITTVSIAGMGASIILYSAINGVDSFAKTAGGMLIGVAVDRLYVKKKIEKGEVPISLMKSVNRFLDSKKEP